MTIAVDFDGTIVENRYPEIGDERMFATETLKMLIQDRHRLILWTCREGRLLDDAIIRGQVFIVIPIRRETRRMGMKRISLH